MAAICAPPAPFATANALSRLCRPANIRRFQLHPYASPSERASARERLLMLRHTRTDARAAARTNGQSLQLQTHRPTHKPTLQPLLRFSAPERLSSYITYTARAPNIAVTGAVCFYVPDHLASRRCAKSYQTYESGANNNKNTNNTASSVGKLLKQIQIIIALITYTDTP